MQKINIQMQMQSNALSKEAIAASGTG